jgi:enoyl-[acyl-carrier protein] reductase II
MLQTGLCQLLGIRVPIIQGPRSLRTPFAERWNGRRAEAEREAGRLREELGAAMREGRAHELVPLTGQTAGMITEVLPVAEIVRRMMAEAEPTVRSLRGLLA